MRKILLASVIAAAFVVAAASNASADSISFNLGDGNPGINGFPGPYATVTVNRTSSNQATITFTGLTNGNNIYLFGGQGTVGVNVNASSWTLGTVTGTNTGVGFARVDADYSNGGAGNEDGFGSFNQTIDSFDGYQHSSNTVTFTLTNTSGTWASAANVLTPQASGYVAAAHIFVTTAPQLVGTGALATGYATGDGSSTINETPVPEPATLTLLGTGLGLAAMRSRRRKTASQQA